MGRDWRILTMAKMDNGWAEVEGLAHFLPCYYMLAKKNLGHSFTLCFFHICS